MVFLVFHSELRAKRLAPIVGAGGAGTAGTTAGALVVATGGAAGAELWVAVGGAGDLCEVVGAADALDAPTDDVADVADVADVGGVVDRSVVDALEAAVDPEADDEPPSPRLALPSGERLAPRAAASWRCRP